jgi:predicted glycosyltransferase
LKIWIDILTPKQLVFFEPLITKLSKKHELLCTSRDYGEATNLAKVRKFDVKVVGKFGGSDKAGKLLANINRMNSLFNIIKKFKPDLTISFCSPDASRISFGLGIKHIAYCDSPHAEAVMKLTLPLIQKLLIPWVIPKKEFSKYGIESKNIIPYRAIDAAITIKRKSPKQKLNFKKPNKKRILIRMEEAQSAYVSKSSKIIPIIKKITDEFSEENIIILGRYSEQIKELKKLFGTKTQIFNMSYDGKLLLENVDVFIGSGGTMTAESALLGVPTISYNASPNLIQDYLVKKNLIKQELNPQKITKIIKKSISTSNEEIKKKAKKLVDSMEDPHSKLTKIVKL